MKMDPEWKAKWIEALESGRYLQGQGKLADKLPDGLRYCCLGVLQNIVSGDLETQPENGLLPNETAVLVGLPTTKSDDFELVSKRHYQKRLARMNDNHVDFPTIAKWIRRYL